MKRFWKEVTIDGREVMLDRRPVRTPGRIPLTLPTDALAQAVAAEWRGVGETIDPRAMPLTGLSNAAIDRIALDPALFATGLAKYGESDLLCYRAEAPPELIARQVAAWDPPLDWARRRYDVRIAVTAGITHHAQPPATIARLASAIGAYDPWRLAGLSPVVTITGSLILALALIEGAMEADAVWVASQVDEQWQIDRWGEDSLAAATTAAHRREFDAAANFMAALA